MHHHFTLPLQQTIAAIVQQVQPAAIYLLGVYNTHHVAESIFTGNPQPHTGHAEYHLLVLPAAGDTRTADQLQDAVEKTPGILPVVAYVVPVALFQQWLITGHYFAHTVLAQVVPCYNTPCLQWQLPAANALPLPTPQNLLQQYRQLATEFYAGAELYIIRGQYAMAALLLHQCVEQLYTGVVHHHTGLRLRTHNLEKLYHFARLFAGGWCNLFSPIPVTKPGVEAADAVLFNLLKQAYTGARYESGFTINAHQANVLMLKVGMLLETLDAERETLNAER